MNRIVKGNLAVWLAIEERVAWNCTCAWRDIANVGCELKLLLSWKQRMQLVLRKISPWKWKDLQKMNVCQILNWDLIFRKFEATPHTQKYEETHWRKKQNGRVEGIKPNDSSYRGKPNKHCERKWNRFVTFWRAKNEQKRFSKWVRGSSLFWNELQILGEE